MHDDDDDLPDFVVSSGTEHRVSVSEVTGNAKTPKNVVDSHPEEVHGRPHAFKQAQEATHAAAHAHEGDAAHGQNKGPAHEAPGEHRQKLAPDAASENRATLPGQGGLAPNVQNVPVDTLAAIIVTQAQISSTATFSAVSTATSSASPSTSPSFAPIPPCSVTTLAGNGSAVQQAVFNGPALLTWSRGQNEYGNNIAGPLPRSWMRAQWDLQKLILQRYRELGCEVDAR